MNFSFLVPVEIGVEYSTIYTLSVLIGG